MEAPMDRSPADSPSPRPISQITRLLPGIGYPLGDVVAIMASPGDAGDAATMLRQLGIPETSIELVDASSTRRQVLIVRRPGRDRIADVRRVLRLYRARRARYYRALVIEELVRVTARWLPDPSAGPAIGGA
jgi:hypothetical protein